MWEYFRYRHEKGSNRSVWPDANSPGTVSVRPCFILHPRHVLVGILTVTDSHDLDSRFVGLKFRRLPSVFNRGAVDCGVIKHPAAITNFLNIPLILQRGIGPGYRVLTQAVVILNPFAFSAEAHGRLFLEGFPNFHTRPRMRRSAATVVTQHAHSGTEIKIALSIFPVISRCSVASSLNMSEIDGSSLMFTT